MKDLEDFTNFYKDNEHLRFWQALSIWCGKNVFTSELPAISVVSQCDDLQDMWNEYVERIIYERQTKRDTK